MTLKQRSAYQLKWHNAHKERTRIVFKRHYDKKKRILSDYLAKVKSQPCADCNKQFHPICMDFDHRDRTTKVNSVSKMGWSGCSLERIKIEIAKCDIVCANCHRLRTYKQFKMKMYSYD